MTTLTWQSFLQKGIWNNHNTYSAQALYGNPSLDDDGTFRRPVAALHSNLQWVNRYQHSRSPGTQGRLVSVQRQFQRTNCTPGAAQRLRTWRILQTLA